MSSAPANVRAAADSVAQALPPEARAAWYAYVAAQSERDAWQDARIADAVTSLASLRGQLDAAIDAAVRRALEGSELRVAGLGALVDSMQAFDRRLGLIETRGDVRTGMLQSILERLEKGVPDA